MRAARRALARTAGLLALLLCGSTAPAHAGQLASLMSPGPLSKAHKAVDGVANCSRCHETGRKVTTTKCLTCHKPIADRIARRAGVHRTAHVGCVTCHTEHAGEAADLRRLDQAKFDHATATGFPLDGVHKATAANCAACHTRRSFLEASTACATCHTDVHKGTLGTSCERCHSTAAPFKTARSAFDHSAAKFPLTGAHVTAKCESCHKNGSFRGVAFSTCASCHTDPHKSRFGSACTTCHTTERWTTRNVVHARTDFPLAGAHAKVACAACHTSGSMTAPLRSNTCASCHVNVHRESLKEDCQACHIETTFRGAPFDHAQRTRFALDGKHFGLECAKCHTGLSPPTVPLARRVVDYGGASRECVACHGPKDPHKGEFGRACDSCHKTATFDVKAFTHAGTPEFYRGFHDKVTCDQCHVPGRTPLGTGPAHPAPACASCHKDVHLGQVGQLCETCHTVDGAHFKATKFSHAQSTFALTGRHESVDCAQCHHTETRAFPAGHGTAMALKPMDVQCMACHKDPHLGQVDIKCDTCHKTDVFKVPAFTHRGLEEFFAGIHGKYACVACHKNETAVFPAGRGTAVRYIVGRACVDCHPK